MEQQVTSPMREELVSLETVIPLEYQWTHLVLQDCILENIMFGKGEEILKVKRLNMKIFVLSSQYISKNIIKDH